MLKALPIAFASLLALWSTLPAQANPDSVHHRNDCRLAAQVITTGHPEPKRDWAFTIIQSCPSDGPPALAYAIEHYRTETDTALLNKITWPAIELRDERMFAAAKRVFADRSASPAARIFAVRVLMWAVRPGGGLYYEALADTSAAPASCFGDGTPTDLVVSEGAPLPPDFGAQINVLAHAILQDENEPRAVRHAAVCAYLATSRPHLAR